MARIRIGAILRDRTRAARASRPARATVQSVAPSTVRRPPACPPCPRRHRRHRPRPRRRHRSLDQEGRGVARIDGKAVFVEGALPGEHVDDHDAASASRTTRSRAPSVIVTRERRRGSTPRCPHFGVCGGCTLQHLDAARAGRGQAARAGGCAVAHRPRARRRRSCRAIHGPAWGYRHRARLSVRHVPKKGGVLVGFHERKSSYVADMTLVPGPAAEDLRAAAAAARADRRLCRCATACRRSSSRSATRARPTARAARRRIRAGAAHPRAARPPADEAPLRDVRRRARRPVLPAARRARDRGAVPSAAPRARLRAARIRSASSRSRRPSSRRSTRRSTACWCGARSRCSTRSPASAIADFFCGLGNFTLPIARRGARGGRRRRQRGAGRAAREANAALNGLADRARFVSANLFAATPESIEALGALDKALIDPPREGAIALVKALPGDGGPRRIVYVSCNPATLARDASVLVHERGYTLARGRRDQHVPAHRACRVDRALRALKRGGRQKKRGGLAARPSGLPNQRWNARQSRWPEKTSSMFSRLMKML